MSALVQAGFDILVEAGYQPEMAYFECVHELKFIVDLMHRAGLSGMRARISETAKWGAISVGPKIIDESVKRRMKKALLDIQDGKFAKAWLRETASGRKKYERLLKRGADQPLERVGDRLRDVLPAESLGGQGILVHADGGEAGGAEARDPRAAHFPREPDLPAAVDRILARLPR